MTLTRGTTREPRKSTWGKSVEYDRDLFKSREGRIRARGLRVTGQKISIWTLRVTSEAKTLKFPKVSPRIMFFARF
jgi:hypothetical protein